MRKMKGEEDKETVGPEAKPTKGDAKGGKEGEVEDRRKEAEAAGAPKPKRRKIEKKEESRQEDIEKKKWRRLE